MTFDSRVLFCFYGFERNFIFSRLKTLGENELMAYKFSILKLNFSIFELSFSLQISEIHIPAVILLFPGIFSGFRPDVSQQASHIIPTAFPA